MLPLDLFQQVMSTDPRFGQPILQPANLLVFALDLQIRTNRVVSRQLSLQVKNYIEYDEGELGRDKNGHLVYMMRVCQSLSRLCSALNTRFQECEFYRSAYFGQQRYSQFDVTTKHKQLSCSPEQSIWYPTRGLLVESTAIARSILFHHREPTEIFLNDSTLHENLGLLWTCLYERIEDLGFQVEASLERSMNGAYAEKKVLTTNNIIPIPLDLSQEGHLLNYDLYQQIMATNPRFGQPVLQPANLLAFALDLQIRTIGVVSRQLAYQMKNYAEYDKDEFGRNMYTHLCHLMRAIQSLARFCVVTNTPLQECEIGRRTHFEQKKHTQSDAYDSSAAPSLPPEQTFWYPGTRSMMKPITAIAYIILLDHLGEQNKISLPDILLLEEMSLLWSCLYERIEDLGFQMENCLKRSILGEFIEKFGYNTGRPEAKVLDHYVTFEDTEEGEHSLHLFIKRMPKEWNANCYEVFRTGTFITQYFRTPIPVDRFVATPLARNLPGSVDWSWNSAHE